MPSLFFIPKLNYRHLIFLWMLGSLRSSQPYWSEQFRSAAASVGKYDSFSKSVRLTRRFNESIHWFFWVIIPKSSQKSTFSFFFGSNTYILKFLISLSFIKLNVFVVFRFISLSINVKYVLHWCFAGIKAMRVFFHIYCKCSHLSHLCRIVIMPFTYALRIGSTEWFKIIGSTMIHSRIGHH